MTSCQGDSSLLFVVFLNQIFLLEETVGRFRDVRPADDILRMDQGVGGPFVIVAGVHGDADMRTARYRKAGIRDEVAPVGGRAFGDRVPFGSRGAVIIRDGLFGREMDHLSNVNGDILRAGIADVRIFRQFGGAGNFVPGGTRQFFASA